LEFADFGVPFALPRSLLLFAVGGPGEDNLVFGTGVLVIGLNDGRSGECVRFGVWTRSNRCIGGELGIRPTYNY
jgi:hypothetical protein